METPKPSVQKFQADIGYDAEEPKSSAIAIFGVAVIALLLIVVLGVQFYFDRVRDQQVYQRVLAPESEDLVNLRNREVGQLYGGAHYADRQKGMVQIPIDRAMEIMVKEYAENRLSYPAKATPIVRVDPLAADGQAAPQSGTGMPAAGANAAGGGAAPEQAGAPAQTAPQQQEQNATRQQTGAPAPTAGQPK